MILLTLLLANFAVPVLSPKQEKEQDEDDTAAEIAILRGVLADLRKVSTPQTKAAVRTVSAQYRLRIERLRRSDADYECLRALHREAVGVQEQVVRDALHNGEVDKRTAQRCLDKLARARRMLAKRTRGTTAKEANPFKRIAASVSAWYRKILFALLDSENEKKTKRARALAAKAQERAIKYLETRKEDPNPGTAWCAAILADEHKMALDVLKAAGATNTSKIERVKTALGISGTLLPSSSEKSAPANVKPDATSPTASIKSADAKGESATGATDGAVQTDEDLDIVFAEVRAKALRMELDRIQEMLEAGRIDTTLARDLREDVYVQQMSLA